ASAKATYYGGGAIPKQRHEQLVSIATRSAHRLDFNGGLADVDQPQCQVAIAAKTNVKVRSDGSFSASGSTRPQGTFEMRGRFTHRDEAVGTAHADYTAGSLSCHTGKV